MPGWIERMKILVEELDLQIGVDASEFNPGAGQGLSHWSSQAGDKIVLDAKLNVFDTSEGRRMVLDRLKDVELTLPGKAPLVAIEAAELGVGKIDMQSKITKVLVELEAEFADFLDEISKGPGPGPGPT
jgi:hypothetical protein